jgi:hypothetical protein
MYRIKNYKARAVDEPTTMATPNLIEPHSCKSKNCRRISKQMRVCRIEAQCALFSAYFEAK